MIIIPKTANTDIYPVPKLFPNYPPPFLITPESMVFDSFTYQISCLVFLGLETPPKPQPHFNRCLKTDPVVHREEVTIDWES